LPRDTMAFMGRSTFGDRAERVAMQMRNARERATQNRHANCDCQFSFGILDEEQRRPAERITRKREEDSKPSRYSSTRRFFSEHLQLLRDVADEDEVSASLPQQTLKTTFMLWLVHRPPMRL
jgi:hypothetical protein